MKRLLGSIPNMQDLIQDVSSYWLNMSNELGLTGFESCKTIVNDYLYFTDMSNDEIEKNIDDITNQVFYKN